MNLEYFIAKRIYTSKENGKGMSPPVRVAVTGVALGMAVMILSIAIISGFKKEVEAKVIGFGSHIKISNFDNNVSYETKPIVFDKNLLSVIDPVPNIRKVEGYATKPGLLKTSSDNQGIVLKGIDGQYDLSFFSDNLKAGSLVDYGTEEISNKVLISRYLSDLLTLRPGDSFLAYFVREDVRARKFFVEGIYETGFEDYDKYLVIADIRQIRRLNGWDDNEVSGLEIVVDDYNQVDETADNLYSAISGRPDSKGNVLAVHTVKELNPMIFDWLSVLDVNVIVMLLLMTAVAGFTMISGLLVIILERIRMIGLLKAMGENDGRMGKIFLYLAFFLIGKGMLWGNVIGLALCIIQSVFRFIKLDASTYYIDAVPINLGLYWIILLNLASMLISMTMMIAPSRVVSTVNPSKVIRFE